MPNAGKGTDSASKRHRGENPYGSGTKEINKSLTVSKEELVLKKHYGANYETYFKNNQNI
jgi:hypothetical protein